MAKIFYPTAEKLRFLLESIHNREIALPDFQRDFVWDPRATEELNESICQNFPAGSLLRNKNSAGFFFSPREVEGAPALNGHTPSYLVLDGQQRLTSLYQAFYGTGSHRFFIHLGGLLAGMDLEDCVFYERQKRAQKRYGSVEQQAETLTFPFALLFGTVGAFEDWLDDVLEHRTESGAERQDLKRRLRELRDQWIRPVEEYEFPMVTLSENTTADAVCTIFETLNRTGVKLSVFDLLAARFWPEDVKLRDLWIQAQETYPIIADFEVDPYYVLQAIALMTAKHPSCKRGEVLDLSVDQIRHGWPAAVDGLVSSLQMLRDDCGVIIPKWLPYSTIVLPLTVAFAFARHITGPEEGAARNRLKRWYWCAVFGQAYERAPNSQSAKDYVELKRWLTGGEAPTTVTSFSFDTSILMQVTPRQRAVYRGVMTLILRHSAIDFHNATQITANMILEDNIDDHHVFPQKYLTENHADVSATHRDCVLNRTLIDRKTNIRISKRAPSDYLQEIHSAIGESKFQKLLESHLLPTGPDSPLLADAYRAFLEARQNLISEEINEVTQ